MLVVVDVGNTNIAVGVFAGDDLKGSWRLNTDIGATGDEYGVQIAGFLQHAGLDVGRCEDVIISSVVPPLARAIHDVAAKYLGHTPILVDPHRVPGGAVEIERPEEVGADRVVNTLNALLASPPVSTSAARSRPDSASPRRRWWPTLPGSTAWNSSRRQPWWARAPSTPCSPASCWATSPWWKA